LSYDDEKEEYLNEEIDENILSIDSSLIMEESDSEEDKEYMRQERTKLDITNVTMNTEINKINADSSNYYNDIDEGDVEIDIEYEVDIEDEYEIDIEDEYDVDDYEDDVDVEEDDDEVEVDVEEDDEEDDEDDDENEDENDEEEKDGMTPI